MAMTMSTTHRIISIGTLAVHPLWHERGGGRTGHATTTLVTSGDQRIIINPGLPAVALRARMSERTDVAPEEITAVFLTSFHIDTRRGIELFDHATVYLHEPERAYAQSIIAQKRLEAEGINDHELIGHFQREREVLDACATAPDKLCPGVDLFPLSGVTPGTCGILLPQPGRTILITGDAIASVEHLQRGQVIGECHDVEQAQESFREAIEIADEIIPGRDNVIHNPLRRM